MIFLFLPRLNSHVMPTLACAVAWDLWLRLAFYVPFPLMGKEPKDQGRLHRTSPRLSKRLTLRSRSTFCEGKRQAPLREGQALSHPLRALPRPAASPPRPPRSGFGVSIHGVRCFHFRSKRHFHTPCRHGGQRSAISYAPGTHPCRRFASSRGTKRSR